LKLTDSTHANGRSNSGFANLKFNVRTSFGYYVSGARCRSLARISSINHKWIGPFTPMPVGIWTLRGNQLCGREDAFSELRNAHFGIMQGMLHDLRI
jgi:hypothetical protein